MWAKGIGLGAMLCFVVFCNQAWADVVGLPPADCPAGSIGVASHAGPYCKADDCSADASRCTGGSRCQAKALCVVDIQGASNGGPFTVQSVVGFCSADGRCSEGTCSTLSVCMTASGVGGAGSSSSPPSSGCSLGVPNTRVSGAAAFWAMGLGAWLVSRRRRTHLH